MDTDESTGEIIIAALIGRKNKHWILQILMKRLSQVFNLRSWADTVQLN